MQVWLASLIAKLVEDLLPKFFAWVGSLAQAYVDHRQEKKDEAQYDKNVVDAISNYKNAKTPEEQDAAFQNTLNTIRRH